mgnify:CR=1 FL=1
MSVLIGLDVGTGGARAVAVDESGEIVAEASSEYPLHSPHPGWTEQDPADWWEGTKEVIKKVATETGEQIEGIGLTGQMHGSVFLDSSDEVIRPALLWNDQRTGRQCEKITSAVGEERLISIAGNPALTGFQAPKIVWLGEEEPDNFGRISHVLLPKDYVRLQLTGEYATDASDAAGTLLLDMRARDWSAEILNDLEIPQEWMPEVYEGPESTGVLRESVAEELGLPQGIPVARLDTEEQAELARRADADARPGRSCCWFCHASSSGPALPLLRLRLDAIVASGQMSVLTQCG